MPYAKPVLCQIMRKNSQALRRRIERATPIAVPLQSKSRVGYVFRAPLKAV